MKNVQKREATPQLPEHEEKKVSIGSASENIGSTSGYDAYDFLLISEWEWEGNPNFPLNATYSNDRERSSERSDD